MGVQVGGCDYGYSGVCGSASNELGGMIDFWLFVSFGD